MDKQRRAAEPQIFSEGAKNLLTTINSAQLKPVVITRKSEIIKSQEGIVEANTPQLLSIYNHFHSIGADRQLISDDKTENRMVLQKWFRELVVNNHMFPLELPVEFVLDEFFNAILQKKVDLKGYNLLAHITAFHSFIFRYKNFIHSKYWAQNPDSRKLELQEQNEKSDEEKAIDNKRVSDSLKAMYGNNVPESMKKYIMPDEV